MRQLVRKSLPPSVYRLDERSPAVIAQEGFQPHNPAGSISIEEHVTGALDTADPSGGNLAKPHSQFVSTAAYGGLTDQKLLSIFAGKFLYRIDTSRTNKQAFTDVNDHFDRAGRKRPFATQREWLSRRGIPGEAVVQFMNATTFAGQLTIAASGATAPSELALTGWQEMPDVSPATDDEFENAIELDPPGVEGNSDPVPSVNPGRPAGPAQLNPGGLAPPSRLTQSKSRRPAGMPEGW